MLAFAGQIFFDFAGYSLCAIGAALTLGFHLKDNFRFPYAAIGFSDFWRRWHISLSTFLRDYLYIPLGGNQVRPFRAALNLVIVMFLGGLWHGAAWTFVVWGLLHGSYLVIERIFRVSFEHKPWASTLPVRVLAGFATYAAVCIAWVFFRASDFTIASRMLSGMFGQHSHGDAILSTRELLQIGSVTAGLIAMHWAMRDNTFETAVMRLPPWTIAAIGSAMICRHHCSLKEAVMRSSISNFKERLRLPRLFFRKPSREEQIHGGPPLEFERPIPPAPWRGIAVVVTIVVIVATAAWELYCRSLGYASDAER